MSDPESIGNLLTAAAVFGLMLSMGLSLTLADFSRILKTPIPFTIGVIGQLVLLPLVAFALAFAFNLPSAIALGLIIIAACPGGSTSNAFSFMARGDVALSVSLTAFSSLIAFVSIPFVVNLGLNLFGREEAQVQLSFLSLAQGVFLTTALPVLIGMGVRYRLPSLAQRLVKPLFFVAFLGILAPSILLVGELPKMLQGTNAWYAFSATALNVIMVVLGYGIALGARLDTRQARTLGIEIGVQNFGLVLLIVLVYLKDPTLVLPAFIYLPSMLITGFLFALLAQRDKKFESALVDGERADA